ncbi:MAG: HlyD family efflux transporter periplasmic adaptor subunit [Chloroflexi bacterium]|nr:HlyD family efflux transporter periplasmic adaptor subunit [Chloroflexota bacterium]
MKKFFYWMTLSALSLILAACGTSAPTAAPPPSAAPQADSTPSGSGFVFAEGVVASAEVQPAREARMSFAVSAPVKEVLVAEGDWVTAGQPLITLYVPDLEGEVTRAELAAKAGELEFSYWVPRRFDRPPERRQQAEAEWNQKKMALEVARAAFAQSILLAPFDAAVAEISVQQGEIAQAGQVVVTLADLAHFQIETTDLSERDVPLVKIGQAAKVYIEALDLTVAGKVTRISPISKTVGGDVVFPVTIELDEQPKGLLWGMSAEVEIQTK